MVTDNQVAEFWKTLNSEQQAHLMRDVLQDLKSEKLKAENQADYSSFKQQFWHKYEVTHFQQALDDLLMQVADYIFSEGQSGINRAMIFMPPRHGKTTNVSRLFPAWLLSRMPELNLLMLSYSDDLAMGNSRYVRNLLLSPRYQSMFPHVKLVGTRADQFYTTENGGVLSSGFSGQLTGHGGKLIIVDDPVKSRSEAESPTVRRRIKEAYRNDIITRLEEPGGAILLMATRWHGDDLPGWLLSLEDADEWTILKFPALALDNDPLGRKPGEALWETRYGVDLLNKRKAKMGSYAFASLYQQQPIAREDALFDTAQIEIINDSPKLKQVVRFYDLAVSAKSTADFSAGVKLGITEDETLIVLDMYRLQSSPVKTGENIILNALRDGVSVPITLEADNASRIQLDYLLRDSRLRGYTIDAVTPRGDKYTRASPLASRVNNGKFKLLRGSWNDALLDEMSVFPGGRNDDQVDALSGAYDMLHEEKSVIVIGYYI